MIRHTRHPATQRLQHQTHYIAWNEDSRVQRRLYPALLLPKSYDNVAQTEIDGTGREGGCDCEADDLQQEAGLVPGIGVGEDAACVAEDLEGAAGCEGEGKGEEAPG